MVALFSVLTASAQIGGGLTQTQFTTASDNTTATPYPSTNIVAGVVGNIVKVTVKLNRVTHGYPDDLDILLVSPNNKAVVLMSDAGDRFSLSNADLTFDDAASSPLPDDTAITAGGSYQPTDYTVFGGEFGAPAPNPTATTLAAFIGDSANGTWRLFVQDDQVVDAGSIASWTLNIFTEPLGTFPTAITMGEDSSTNVNFSFTHDDKAALQNIQDNLQNSLASRESRNDAIIADEGLVISGSGTNRTLTINPVKDANGVVELRIHLRDGTTTKTFPIAVTIQATNDAPTLTLGAASVNTTQGVMTTNIPIKIGDVDTDPDVLEMAATSAHPSIVGDANIFFTGTGTNRQVAIAPNGAATGSATITIKVIDRSGATHLTNSATMVVNIAPAPYRVQANTGTIAINDDSAASPYPSSITVSNVNGTVGRVTVTLADISHPSPEDLQILLVAPNGAATLLMTGAGANNALDENRITFDDQAANPIPDAASITNGLYQPEAYAAGNLPVPAPAGITTDDLSVFAGSEPNGKWDLYVFNSNNGGAGDIQSGWVINIYPGPKIGPLTNQTTLEDKPITVSFLLSDQDGTVTNLTATSDDLALGDIVAGSVKRTATTGEFTFAPVAHQHGTNTITLVATDNHGQHSTNTLDIIVEPVNDAPVIEQIAKQTTFAGQPVGPIIFNINDIENASEDLDIIAQTSNPKLLPVGNIVFGEVLGNDNQRTVTLFPAGIQDSVAEADITLRLTDDGTSNNVATTTFRLTVQGRPNPLFENSAAITINDNAKANPYPSSMAVSGIIGTVAEVKVTLFGLTHPNPDDLDILLVGPTGRKVVIMSDAGNVGALNDAVIILGDNATEALPDASSIISGFYQPANYEAGDPFPDTPSGAIDPTLATFNGVNPNGTWQLFVIDDTASVRGGVLAGGWQLSFRTRPVVSPITAQTTEEDVTKRVAIVIGDNQPGVNLTVNTSSSIPSGMVDVVKSITVEGTGANRTLLIEPEPNISSTNLVSVTVTDAEGTTTPVEFEFRVTPVDDVPTITGLAASYSTPKGVALGPLAFAVDDVESADDTLTVVGTSDAPTVVPDGNIIITKTGGGNRTLQIIPLGIATGRANIKLTVTDGTGQKNSVDIQVNVEEAVALQQPAALAISDAGESSSALTVKDINGLISRVTVTIPALSHAFPDDIDMVLAFTPTSGTARKIMLMSDAGGGVPGASNVRLTFADNAATAVPDTTLPSGMYIPHNYDGTVGPNPDTDNFTGVAAPYGDSLTSLVGSSPNGTWTLYVRDDTFGENGSIPSGWILIIETAPSIAPIGAQETPEDVPLVLEITLQDADTAASKLTVLTNVTGNDPANLVKNTNVVVTGTESKRTVTITPTKDLFGTNLITLTVSDGTTQSPLSFPLRVTAVDDPPTVVTPTPNLSTNFMEDVEGVLLFTIADVDSTVADTNVVVTSSNPAVVKNDTNHVVVTTGATRQDIIVTLKPEPNAFGQTEITINVSDKNSTTKLVVKVTYDAVNDTPTITEPDDISIIAGTSTTNILFKVADVETQDKSLVVTASSDNQAVVPNGNIVLGGAGPDRTIMATSIGNVAGSATITIQVVDDNPTATRKTNSVEFEINVNAAPGNDFANAAPITIRDNTTSDPYGSAISVAGMRGPVSRITVTLDGFNHTAPDDVDILLVGPGATPKKVLLLSDAGGRNPVGNVRLVLRDGGAAIVDDAPLNSGTFAPANFEPGTDVFAGPAPAGPYATRLSEFNGTDPNGTWTLFVVDDFPSDSGRVDFGWTIRVETAPTISNLNPTSIAILEDQTQILTFTIDDMDPLVEPNLTLNHSSDNPNLINGVTFDRSASPNITATVSLKANQFGTNNLTVTVERADKASHSVVIPMNVSPQNDAPTISRILDKSTQEDTTLAPFEFRVEDIERDLGQVSRTNINVMATSSNQAIINNTNILFFGVSNEVKAPDSPVLSLTLRPNPDAIGTAVITVTVTDFNESPALTVQSNFNFTITERNDPPTITAIDDKVIQAGTSTTNIAFTVGDPEGQNVTITATSSDQAVVRNADIFINTITGAPGAREVRVTALPGIQNVSTTIRLTVKDSGASPQESFEEFVVTVRPSRERVFSNTKAIVINDRGAATDYPSTISVSGLVGRATKVAAIFNGFHHRFPDDVDALLVSPNGTKVWLMSDAGGGAPQTNLVLTFDQTATDPIPDTSLAGGNWRPGNYDPAPEGDLPAPAPASPYSSANLNDLNGVTGADLNGDWRLFIVDDTASDAGGINGGWTLKITTEPIIMDLPDATVNEDEQALVSFTIAEEEFAELSFTFTGSSTNQNLVVNSNIVVTGSGTKYTATITPNPDASGTTEITINASNKDGQTVSDKMKLTVTPRNDAPTITAVNDLRITSGGVSDVVAFTYGDAETDKKDLGLTIQSSNPKVLPERNILLIGNTLRVVADANVAGSSEITITVTDGTLSTEEKFVVTIDPSQNPIYTSLTPLLIKDSPRNSPAEGVRGDPYPSTLDVVGVQGTVVEVQVTLSGLSHSYPDDIDLLLVGPQGQKVMLMSDAGSGGTEDSMLDRIRLTFAQSASLAVPDNSAITPFGTYRPANWGESETLPAPAPTGPYSTNLSVFNGTDPNGTWSLYVVDDASPDEGSMLGGWFLTIISSAPTASKIDDQTVLEDAPLVVSFAVNDGDTAAANLIVEVQSSDDNIISAVAGGSGSSRTITLTPRANLEVGTVTITLGVSDGTTKTTATFQASIAPVNDAPVISGLVPLNVPANLISRTDFLVSDVDSASSSLSVTASVENAEVGQVSINGSGNEWQLTFAPNGVQASTTVSVIATDGNASTTNTIQVVVIEPLSSELAPIADQIVAEDSTPSFGVIVLRAASAFTITGTASNPAVIQSVEVSGSGMTQTAVIRLVPNAVGESDVTFALHDDFLGDSVTFKVTVTPVNDAPTISLIADAITDEDKPVNVSFTVADIDTPLNELSFSASSSNPALLGSATFTPGENGVVVAQITPGAEQSGVTAITIAVTDGIGTATTAFALGINAVNDPTVIAPIADVVVDEDTSSISFAITLTDADSALANITLTASGFDANLLRSVSVLQIGDSTIVAVRPVPNASGSTTVTITATEGGVSGTQTFNVNVTDIPDAPILGALSDKAAEQDTVVVFDVPVTDADTAISALTITGSSSDTDLVTSITFAVNGNVVSGTISLAAGDFGDAVITINVDDGSSGAVSGTFNLKVNEKISTPPALAASITAGNLSVRIIGPANRIVTVEGSGNLVDWTAVSTVTLDQEGSGTFTVPASGNWQFFRVTIR